MALNYQKHKSELTSPSQIKTKRGAFWKHFPWDTSVREAAKRSLWFLCQWVSWHREWREGLLGTARGLLRFQGQRKEKQSSPVTASMEGKRKLPSPATVPIIPCSLLPPPGGALPAPVPPTYAEGSLAVSLSLRARHTQAKDIPQNSMGPCYVCTCWGEQPS